MSFARFLDGVVFDNPITVNRESVRHEIKLPNGIIAYYTEVLPFNFLKRSYSYVFLNVQIKNEHLKDIIAMGGTLEDIYCSDGFGVPQFKDLTNTFKDLESAYKFATEYTNLFNNENILQ